MSLAETICDAWNTHHPGTVAELFANGGVRHQFAYEETRHEGHDAIAATVGAIMNSWPDAVLSTRNAHDGDGWYVIEWTFDGTFQADFGPIPANGARTVIKGVSCITRDSAGLIVEERVYWDGAGILVAAGVLG